MRRLLLLCLLLISLAAQAQSRYSAFIETPKASVSGILVLATVDGEVRGSLFNEFGLTALSFTYQPAKDKVRLHTVLPALDKWYIRRVLRRDLRQLLHRLQQGQTTYENPRYHITYTFTPL